MREWRDIGIEKGVDFTGLYQVSNDGLVKSVSRFVVLTGRKTGVRKFIKEQVRSQRKNRGGYMMVTLYKDGVGYDFLVHRLVASAFIPNQDNLPLINHKNKDRTDNHVENLEWCTAEYNSNYADRNECLSRSLVKALKRKKVAQIDKDGNTVKIWQSVKEASENGFSMDCLYYCLREKNAKSIHKGFHWRYVE